MGGLKDYIQAGVEVLVRPLDVSMHTQTLIMNHKPSRYGKREATVNPLD